MMGCGNWEISEKPFSKLNTEGFLLKDEPLGDKDAAWRWSLPRKEHEAVSETVTWGEGQTKPMGSQRLG